VAQHSNKWLKWLKSRGLKSTYLTTFLHVNEPTI
jgi:hypothetical protein